MLKIILKYPFSQFKTQVVHIQQHTYGPLQQSDYKVLNVNQRASLRDIYYSYMKHIRLYEIQEQEDKMELIKGAYLRILSTRLQSLDELSEEDTKDLRLLMDNNFGFPFVEGLRRSQLITQFQEEIEAKRIYHYPRILLAIGWLILGIPSIYLSDTYTYV